MHQFHRTGRPIERTSLDTDNIPGCINQDRAYPFTLTQYSIAHRLVQAPGLYRFQRQPTVERLFYTTLKFLD